MKKGHTYLEHLRISHDFPVQNKKNWLHEIQNSRYADLLAIHQSGQYGVDFTNRSYTHANDIMASYTDHPLTEIKQGGLDLVLPLWHQKDFQLYNEKIFPKSVAFLADKPREDYHNYLFTCNYRVKHHNGKYIHVEQSSIFSAPLDNGMPLAATGFLRDVTHRIADNKIIHNIEYIGPKGRKCIETNFHDPDKADTANLPDCSSTEIMIAKLTAEGKRSKETAVILNTSHENIRLYKKNIIRKTNAENMIHAITILRELGILI